MISEDKVKKAILKLFEESQTRLGDDVLSLLNEAYETEEVEFSRKILGMLLESVEIAKKEKVPICQDTGIPIFFLEIGREVRLNFNIYKTITEAVREATKKIPLRPNTVHPILRSNPGDNTGLEMPLFYTKLVEGKRLKISLIPKGAGSENVSLLGMLPPSPEKILRFILEAVKKAGGKPCPPIFVGVGIGSSFDGVSRLAKEALLRNAKEMNEFELEIREKINKLGIGPMGLGGKWTSLAVLVNIGHCHTASLPVAVNIQCWAHRKASVVLR